ncbi:hypothetical protein [Niabella soli]|uniref:Uncharacterized protein n=1 Tax=Niabella soli DSM 19437 TaxID=929713 RepID=W0F2H9_9BACT|nr:hypothetical protein [Niabella soli]AHF17240.1 hypothetical protein NIASO_04420 [Niabella soli DSM 19437]
MNSKNDAFSILERHVPDYLLRDYTDGVLSPEKNKLYGFALTEIVPDQDDQYSYINEFSFYSTMGSEPEKEKTYSDDGNTYQFKDKELCLREGVYKFLAITFFGCLYQGQWYVFKGLRFYGALIGKEDILSSLATGITDGNVFDNTVYRPLEEYYSCGQPTDNPVRRGIEFLEFVGMPELAAYHKQEAKQDLLAAHKAYLRLAVFKPFMNRLRADNFEVFNKFTILHGWNLSLIFSSSRDYVLMPVVVMNEKKEHHLYYFLWHTEEKKMYRWNYFSLKNVGERCHYANKIIEDLSQISYWDHENYLDSDTCTLDDNYFWTHYVLGKDNDHYRYLMHMEFESL